MNPRPTLFTGLALVLAVTFITACECKETNVVLDDFQFCDDGCGWQAESGAPLETTRTFHSAERGLIIPPGVLAQRVDGAKAEEFHVVSNCPTGLVVYTSPEEGAQPFFLHATTSERDNAWYRLAVVISDPGQRFDYLAIKNTTDSACIIDQVRVFDLVTCLP